MAGRVWRRTVRAAAVVGDVVLTCFLGVFYVAALLAGLIFATVRLGWADGKRGGRGIA